MASLVWLFGMTVVMAQAPAPAASPADRIIALYLRGSAALEEKEFRQAIVAFNEIIALEPGSARAYLGRAIAYHRTGDLDRALADYEKVSRLSKNVQALVNQGMIHADRGRLDKALTAYTEALRLDPANTQTYYRRALVYEQLGQYDKALADYDTILHRQGRSAFLFTARANVHVHIHQYDEAVKDYREALTLHPNQADTCNCLAWLLATCPSAEVRNGAEALFYAQKANELTGWQVDVYLDTLAAACAECGDFNAAVRWELKALKLPSEVTEMLSPTEGLGTLNTMNGKERAEAQQRLKRYEQHQACRQP